MSEAVDQSSPAARVATGRDWQRGVRFFVICGGLAVPFLLLLLLVTDKWAPLAAADQGARDSLHVFALGESWFVSAMRTFSDSGSSLAWQIVTVVVTLLLLVRRHWRLAAFVVVTIAGSSLVNTAVKAMVSRDRPLVDQPFVNEPAASFPSGHSQAAVVGYMGRSVRGHLDPLRCGRDRAEREQASVVGQAPSNHCSAASRQVCFLSNRVTRRPRGAGRALP